MSRILVFTCLALLAVAGPVAAQKGTNAVSIQTKPAKVVFGKATTISGQVTGAGNAGVTVELEAQPAPYSSGFKAAGTVVTDANGGFSFTVTPQLSTAYRVDAKTKPRVRSGEATVLVAMKVGLRVSDRTPARGQAVGFGGSVRPAHDGKTASLQRRTRTGFKTIATVTTVAATPVNGVTRSTYYFKRKVRRTGRYRVIVASGETDHVDGRSRSRRLRVH
jgi:hypothetical protein